MNTLGTISIVGAGAALILVVFGFGWSGFAIYLISLVALVVLLKAIIRLRR